MKEISVFFKQLKNKKKKK